MPEARAEPEDWTGSRSLARRLRVSPTYFAKITQALVRSGILEAQRGKTGGVRLSRPAGKIRVIDVVTPFDDLTPARQCLLGQGLCSDRTPCAAHYKWKEAGTLIAEFFRNTTVEGLL